MVDAATAKSTHSTHPVGWYLTGFKAGINHQAPTVVPGGTLAQVQQADSGLSKATTLNPELDLLLAQCASVRW